MSEMDVEAVVFDMDGVLVESEAYWSEEMETILATALPAEADVTPADVTGISISDQYDMLSADHEMQVGREAYFDLYDQCAEEIYLERADVTDSASDMVHEMADAGFPVGLATSSFPQWVEWALDRLDLEDVLDAVVMAPDLDDPGKPEPHIYREAAKRAGAYVIAYQIPGADSEQDVSAADEVAVGAGEPRERVRAVALDQTSPSERTES